MTGGLGVCNGCQLLALLGLVPWRGLADPVQPRFIRNASGRFESRFVSVKIEPSPAVMLDGMAGSTLGIWVQHGEGQALFPDRAVLDRVLAENLAPLRFADDEGRITESYPFNPTARQKASPPCAHETAATWRSCPTPNAASSNGSGVGCRRNGGGISRPRRGSGSSRTPDSGVRTSKPRGRRDRQPVFDPL